jgi:hypothetical protein
MEPVYEVVSPAGDAVDAAASSMRAFSAGPLDGLDGKKLGLVWTEFANGDTALRAFRQHLAGRFPGLEFVEMVPGRGKRWGDLPDASIADLARELGVNGVVVAAGC